MKTLIGSLVGMVLLCIVLLVIHNRTPHRMAANVLIEETGRYRSPGGDCFVDLWEENKGQLKFLVYKETEAGREGNGPSKSFRAKSDWLMCWDSQDRLWTYVPEQDRQYCRYWYATGESTGSARVGNRRLAGGPGPFLALLPEIVKEIPSKGDGMQESGSSEQAAPSDG
jgi:hypothetical protein